MFYVIDIDECENNPCQNGGTCEDALAGYACTCRVGFTGENCAESKTLIYDILGINKNRKHLVVAMCYIIFFFETSNNVIVGIQKYKCSFICIFPNC